MRGTLILIEGGFYLKARRIQEAEIMHAPPHVREIWDWLLMKAMFADGISLQRGQVLTTYEDIREGLFWYVGWRKERYSKWDCEKAMKVLTKATMITTKKTTRGLIVTILNYDYYQNPKNYESHNESHRKATRKPQTTDTIDKNVIKKERNIIPPKLEWVERYCKERKNGIDPQYFIDQNEKGGWVYGKAHTPIKDWQATIRTWEKNATPKPTQSEFI